MAYTTVKKRIWKSTSSNWFVNLVYQYEQDNESGISKVKILGFEFSKLSDPNDWVYGTQTFEINCKGKKISWTVSSPIPTGTYTKEWYAPNPLETTIECDDEGNTNLLIQYKCYHSATNTRIPHISTLTDMNITLPKMDERGNIRFKDSGQWYKGQYYEKISGQWYKCKIEEKLSGAWN